MSEWYEARREAMGEAMREMANDSDEYGYCPDCYKVDASEIYQEVVDKINRMIKRLQSEETSALSIHNKNTLKSKLIRAKIDALSELKEILL